MKWPSNRLTIEKPTHYISNSLLTTKNSRYLLSPVLSDAETVRSNPCRRNSLHQHFLNGRTHIEAKQLPRKRCSPHRSNM